MVDWCGLSWWLAAALTILLAMAVAAALGLAVIAVFGVETFNKVFGNGPGVMIGFVTGMVVAAIAEPRIAEKLEDKLCYA